MVGLASNFAMTTSNLPLRGGLGAAALCAAATQSAYPIHQMLTALNSVFTGHLNNMESAMGRRVRCAGGGAVHSIKTGLTQCSKTHVAIGMRVTSHPPHRTGRAAFPHE